MVISSAAPKHGQLPRSITLTPGCAGRCWGSALLQAAGHAQGSTSEKFPTERKALRRGLPPQTAPAPPPGAGWEPWLVPLQTLPHPLQRAAVDAVTQPLHHPQGHTARCPGCLKEGGLRTGQGPGGEEGPAAQARVQSLCGHSGEWTTPDSASVSSGSQRPKVGAPQGARKGFRDISILFLLRSGSDR